MGRKSAIKTFFLFIASLGDWLGAIPAMFWFLYYIASVFFFAIIYTIFPKGFYHATSQYEQNLKIDKEYIEKELTSLIKSRLKNRPNPFWLDKDNKDYILYKSIDFKSVKVNTFSIDSSGFNFKVYVWRGAMLGLYDKNRTKWKPSVTVKDWEASLVNAKTEDNYKSSGRYISLQYENTGVLDRIFVNHNWFKSNDSRSHIYISSNLRRKIDNFRDALDGFPQKSTGDFERMFYLSAVTITTLGYGDIVPITPITRILIWIEATSGVFIVGLFFNSLASQINLKARQNE
jgi:Ion channel